MKGGRKNSFNNDFDRSARGSHGSNKGFRGNDFDSQRMSNRGGDKQSFKGGPRREGFGKIGGRNSFNDDFDDQQEGLAVITKDFGGTILMGREGVAEGLMHIILRGLEEKDLESSSVEGLKNIVGTRTGALMTIETVDA
ncbi:DNA polymerase zeta catalytic subunit [Prunus yedoensis var. nudiflora]|uniref:DNA polymerase zeta catalytic subunit n=1 Tax=Prunus yedoensis var. nudiflora TaxID=2094558 RepID=A0A314YK07_PRUYE|nr:DNA polymerase zeta catalytic subunit [Prunus yedoensis var. nudiflora]